MNKHLISSCSLICLNGHSNEMSAIGMHDCYCAAFPQTVDNIVEVLDTIQVWPEEVVEDMGSE